MGKKSRKSKGGDPRRLVANAEALEEAGRWPDAASLWQQLVLYAIREEGEHSPAVQQMYYRLALALFESGEQARAATTMHQAWKLIPRPLDFEKSFTRALYTMTFGLLFRSNRYAEAAEAMREALPAMERASGSSQDTLLLRGNLGEILRRVGHYDEAEQYLRAAIAQAARMSEPDATDLAALYSNLGLTLLDAERPIDAQEPCRRSVKYCRRAGEPAQLAIALDNYGRCLNALGEFGAAEGVITEAMTYAREAFTLDSADTKTVRFNLSAAKAGLGKLDEARELLLDTVADGGTSALDLDSLVQLVHISLKLPDAGEAERLVAELDRRLRRPEVPLQRIWHYQESIQGPSAEHALSLVDPDENFFDFLSRRYQAQVNTMELHFDASQRRALGSAEAMGIRPRVSAIETMGVRHLITEQSLRFAHFISERDTPLAQSYRFPDAPDEVSHARLQAAFGESDMALETLTSATTELMRISDIDAWLRAMYAKATIELAASRLEAALDTCDLLCREGGVLTPETIVPVLQVAADAFGRLGARRKQFAALLGAHSCVRDSDVVDAWTRHYLELQVLPLLDPDSRQELVSEKISAVWEYLGLPLDNAISPNVYETDELDPVDFARVVWFLRRDINLRVTEHINVDLMQRAATAFEHALDLVNASQVWLTLAEDFIEGGNELAFQGCLARAQRLLHSKPGEWWFDVHRLEARAAYLNGDRQAAIDALDEALDIADHTRVNISIGDARRNYFTRVADAARTQVALLLAEGRVDDAWIAAERANSRSLLDVVAGRAAAREAPGQVQPTDGGWRTLIDPKLIRNVIGENEALVAPVLVADGVAAFVVTRGELSVHQWGADHAAIASRVAEFRSLLEPSPTEHADLEQRILRCAQGLYGQLIAPLSQVLDGIRHLVWVPEYGLYSLPVDCLHDGSRYLAEMYSVVTCFSATVYAHLIDAAHNNQAEPPSKFALILGDSLDDLPHALRECQTVSELLNGRGWEVTALLGPQATWQYVEPKLAASRLIHIACHGTFNPAFPERSFVRLSAPEGVGGNLTMDRLADVQLPGTLVVMTSCHTGAARIGMGNEVSGFVRRLVESNAHTVVAPLWELGDEVATALMSTFYPLILDGARPGEALQAAKIRLIQEPTYPSPRHWGPVQLFGVNVNS